VSVKTKKLPLEEFIDIFAIAAAAQNVTSLVFYVEIFTAAQKVISIFFFENMVLPHFTVN